MAVDSAGIAAIAVLVFHMTTRSDQLYPDHPAASEALPLGHFGRRGLSSGDYRKGLRELNSIVSLAGAAAPNVVAYATVCRSPPDAVIRGAIDAETVVDARFRRGPDLDTLRGDALRHDGCHFSALGLERAAGLWRAAIVAAAAPHSAR